MYAQELKALVDESPNLREALVAEVWISTEHDTYKAGEYVRGLAKLEAEERDRCASFCAKAVAAGLVKKQTELAQIQGEMLVKALQAVLDQRRTDRRTEGPGQGRVEGVAGGMTFPTDLEGREAPAGWAKEPDLHVQGPRRVPRHLGRHPDHAEVDRGAQARTIKRNRRPVMSWDIARFGEDETVGMRREGAGSACTARIRRPTR